MYSDFFLRYLLAYVYIPVIQKELDIFCETVWNSHRVRCQKNAQLPKGIPNHIYNFPEEYNAQEHGTISQSYLILLIFKPKYHIYHCNAGVAISNELLDEVAVVSGVLNHDDDYLPMDVRESCEAIIPEVSEVKSKDAADTFLFLKAHYTYPE